MKRAWVHLLRVFGMRYLKIFLYDINIESQLTSLLFFFKGIYCLIVVKESKKALEMLLLNVLVN